jgi:DNA polymerase-3 subunit epsilon
MFWSQPCAIIDLETTGGHIGRDRITEIGLILLDQDRIERFSSLVNPGQPIPPFIENMTGISDAMVADAPGFSSLAPALLTRLQGRLLLAHNARFDYGVLKNEFKRAGLSFQSETLCTVKLSRRLYPQYFKHNLDAIIARHQISLPARHRALADAEGVYLFLLAATQELGEQTLWHEAQALIGQETAPEGLDAATFAALPDVPGVYWAYDTAGAALYVGAGDNIRRQVLAHFAGAQRREVQLTGQVGKIEWRETVGAFGLALLELVQLKTLRPRLNVRGRMACEACTLRLELHEDGFLRPATLPAERIGRAAGEHYGLFKSAREAKKALQELARSNGLCRWVLGVERVTSANGKPCEGLARGLCRGACIGRESVSEHNARLKTALRSLALSDWPFAAQVAIVEQDQVSGAVCEYVFDRWCYLGQRPGGQRALPQAEPLLDLDVYRLLGAYFRKPLPGTTLRQLEPV